MCKAKVGYAVDDILPFIGEFGRFQYLLEGMLCISIIPQTLQVLIMYFAAHNPGWRCAPNSNVCFFNQTLLPADNDYNFRCNGNMTRADWEFARPKDYSITTQFDLYCDTEIYGYFTTSFFFIGWAIGAVVLGLIADWFGRLKVLFPSLAVLIVVGFASAFSPNFWVFLASRIITGFFTPGVGVQMFIMASEFVGNKHRPLAGIGLWFFFTIALLILGAQAYFIRQWKLLFIVCTAPYIFVFAFAKFIPESVRWLNLNGQTEKAMNILRRIAKFNKKQIPDHVTLQPPTNDGVKEKGSPLDLFRPPKMAIGTLVQAYAWLVNGLVYYGVALAADDLGGEMYRDYILTSLVEFPAVILAIVLCNKIGRKKTIVPSMFLAGVACISVAFIPNDKKSGLGYFRIVLGMIGKLGVSIAFDAIYTWSVELYPTIVRSQAMGFLQITSRMGAAGAPWVAKYLKVVHAYAPFGVMGGCAVLSSITMIYLPETKGAKTVETLEKTPKETVAVGYDKALDNAFAKTNLAFHATEENTTL